MYKIEENRYTFFFFFFYEYGVRQKKKEPRSGHQRRISRLFSFFSENAFNFEILITRSIGDNLELADFYIPVAYTDRAPMHRAISATISQFRPISRYRIPYAGRQDSPFTPLREYRIRHQIESWFLVRAKDKGKVAAA